MKYLGIMIPGFLAAIGQVNFAPLYLWENKKPRTNFEILRTPNNFGGIAFPDLSRYQSAGHLARVIEQSRNYKTKQWVQLEQAQTEVPLWALPWCNKRASQEIKRHPTIGCTLKFSKKNFQKEEISPGPSPFYSVVGNPVFPPVMENPILDRCMNMHNSRVQGYIEGIDGKV